MCGHKWTLHPGPRCHIGLLGGLSNGSGIRAIDGAVPELERIWHISPKESSEHLNLAVD